MGERSIEKVGTGEQKEIKGDGVNRVPTEEAGQKEIRVEGEKNGDEQRLVGEFKIYRSQAHAPLFFLTWQSKSEYFLVSKAYLCVRGKPRK